MKVFKKILKAIEDFYLEVLLFKYLSMLPVSELKRIIKSYKEKA